MMRAGTVPPWLRRALRPSPHCYGHCDRPLRGRTAALPAPGWLAIYACPGGAVSVVTYTHWANPDPTTVPAVRRGAQAHGLLAPRHADRTRPHRPAALRAREPYFDLDRVFVGHRGHRGDWASPGARKNSTEPRPCRKHANRRSSLPSFARVG